MSAMQHLSPRHDHGTFTAAEIAEQSIDPYEDTPRYARGTIYFICGAIALFALANALHHLRQSPSSRLAGSRNRVNRKVAAKWRFLATKQQKLAGRWRFPVLGTGLLMLAFFAFMMIWTWRTQPYYRSRWNVGSPPLAMRSGFMALGCFPFIIAFGVKFNFITFITGCSHEKLQVYHQFMSHLFLVLSLIHTFPFVIAGMREIKPDTGGLTQLEWSWHVAHKVYYWSGTALLVLLAWLCWASLPVFRKRYYEAFKWLHIVSAIMFTGFFFVHCNKLLGSWDYLYATVVIWAASTLGRFTYMFVINGAEIPRARFEVLGAGMVKLKIAASPVENWRPGQHYFLNFPTCQPFQSHPFTLASIPHPTADEDVDQEMTLLIRSASGLTQKLRNHLCARQAAGKGETIPVLLDGPYGGLEGELGIYEHAVLIAGGTGITFVLPVLEDLVEKMALEPEKTVCKSVELVWSVRSEDSIEWAREALDEIADLAPTAALSIRIHVTSSDGLSSPASLEKGKEADESASLTSSALEALAGRADLKALIRQSATNESVGVAACGPAGLVFDVRNAVADVQRDILLGRTGCAEMFLHTEEYSW